MKKRNLIVTLLIAVIVIGGLLIGQFRLINENKELRKWKGENYNKIETNQTYYFADEEGDYRYAIRISDDRTVDDIRNSINPDHWNLWMGYCKDVNPEAGSEYYFVESMHK